MDSFLFLFSLFIFTFLKNGNNKNNFFDGELRVPILVFRNW